MPSKYALIIACSDYRDKRLKKLPKTEADAEGMRSVLADPKICGFPPKQIELLVNKTAGEVRIAIERFFKNRHKNDLLFFYFSGHGLIDDHRRLTLALNETNPDYRTTGIDATFLREEMENSRSRRQLIILDACNSGAFANVRDAVGSAAGIDEALQGEGRVVLAASDKLQYSFENLEGREELRNGVFTHYLIEGLRQFKAVSANGETITVNSLYRYAFQQVTTATERKQTPAQIMLDRSIGDLVLAKKPQMPLPSEIKNLLDNPDPHYRIIAVRKLLEAVETGLPYASAAKTTLEHLKKTERDFEVRQELEKSKPKVASQSTSKKRTDDKQRLSWMRTMMIALAVGLGIVFFPSLYEQLFTPATHPEKRTTNAKKPVYVTAKNPTEVAHIKPPEVVNKKTVLPKSPPKPGTIFRDKLKSGGEGPAMVVIPAGSFQMGSTKVTDGDERDDDEKQHRVETSAFAMAQYEVTVGEFRRFVVDTNYKTTAETTGKGCYGWDEKEKTWNKDKKYSWKKVGFSQQDDHPVACVSWHDASAFASWMAEQTGQQYRLPTEAQWEYAARGGTKTRRYWGDDTEHRLACNYANVADEQAKADFATWTTHACDDGYPFTSPVGTFTANKYQLHDMLGNVWEWTCSAFDKDYGGAEKECGVEDESDSRLRVLRGGSWIIGPRWVRSANRYRNTPSYRNNVIGFRLARTN